MWRTHYRVFLVIDMIPGTKKQILSEEETV